MRNLVLTAVTLTVVAMACGGETAPSAPRESVDPTVAAARPAATATAVAAFRPTAPVTGASVEVGAGRIVTTLPTSSCIETTATPLVIGEFVVFATHKKSPKPNDTDSASASCVSDPVKAGVYAVSQRTGEAFLLIQGDGEATAAYVDGTLIVPMLAGSGSSGGIGRWSGGASSVNRPISAGIDSAGLWDATASRFIVGTVNQPFAQCQTPVNNECGALFAIDSGDKVTARLDATSGFRGWLTGAPVWDGGAYVLGTGAGTEGADAVPGKHECSVVRVSREFKVLASYDDGAAGCTKIGNLESAVVGEVAVAGEYVWAQHLGSSDGRPIAGVVRLRRNDLTLSCRAEVPVLISRSTAGFYQAPVADAQGNAYVVARTTDNQMKATILKIGPDCRMTTLLKTNSDQVSTPTLADDRFVLVAADGALQVIDRSSATVRSYALPAAEGVVAGVAVGQYGVTVVDLSGRVTTFGGTGISGYGSDPWPRFRKDNSGSATAP